MALFGSWCRQVQVARVEDRLDVVDGGGDVVEQGSGEQVLDSPLRALHHFVQALRSCPGAPDLGPQDVVTTGTWTDAWPIQAGETWTAAFTPPLSSLRVAVR